MKKKRCYFTIVKTIYIDIEDIKSYYNTGVLIDINLGKNLLLEIKIIMY